MQRHGLEEPFREPARISVRCDHSLVVAGLRAEHTGTRAQEIDGAAKLWLEAVGLPAVLPPAEEARDVKTATGAGRAQDARKPAPRKTRSARR